MFCYLMKTVFESKHELLKLNKFFFAALLLLLLSLSSGAGGLREFEPPSGRQPSPGQIAPRPVPWGEIQERYMGIDLSGISTMEVISGLLLPFCRVSNEDAVPLSVQVSFLFSMDDCA